MKQTITITEQPPVPPLFDPRDLPNGSLFWFQARDFNLLLLKVTDDLAIRMRYFQPNGNNEHGFNDHVGEGWRAGSGQSLDPHNLPSNELRYAPFHGTAVITQ